MKKNLNRKGFTLVELLAVIIVLAIILVVAAPAVLNTMNSSKKNAFKLYAERVVTNAQTVFLTYVTDPSSAEGVTKGEDGNYYIPFSALGFQNAENYDGCIVVTSSTTTGLLDQNATYTVYLTDGAEFTYNGVDSKALGTGNITPIETEGENDFGENYPSYCDEN